jgi:hypothetical protein
MSNNDYTYNVLIARFRDFVEGHYILKRFTHGQIADADLAKNNLYPWLHVVPEGINFSEGTKAYNFSVMIADLPREKEEKNTYQAEVISDCLQIFSDLIATIENGTLFGRDVVLGTPVNVEAFIQEQSNSLTGVEGSITINVDYNWNACDVPANFNPFTPITGEPPTFSPLHFDNSLNLDGNSVTLDNDIDEPGNTYYYGTNSEGVKGWYALPSGNTFTCNDVDACPTILGMLQDITDLQNDKANSGDLGAVAFSNDYNDLDNLPAVVLTAPNLDTQRSAGLGNEYNIGDVVHYAGNIYRCLATNSGIIPTDPVYWALVGPGYPTRQNIIDYNATTGDAQIINKPNLFSGDYDDLTNKPALAAVATSGDYNDLDNLPSLFSGDYGDLTNAPTLATVATTGDYNDLLNTPDLSGYGDMLKSTYDVDNDGVVDMAKKEVVEVINKTGATLTKGTICYIKTTSSSGTHPEVLKANANSEATSSKTMGAIYEDLPNNQVGFLVTSGEVRNLDTSAYNTGSMLWLATTDGQVTTTPPAEPNHAVFIGHVTRSQNVNGRVLYAIQNGYELTEIHGVLCPSPATNDVLKYDGSLWVNSALTKSDVGLANVDNTSDANKPISTATQNALNGKAAVNSGRSILQVTYAGSGLTAGQVTFANFSNIAGSATEAPRRLPLPIACTLSNFYILTSSTQPASGTLVLTIRKNSADTALVITVASNSVAGVYANTANNATFVAGDLMCIRFNNNATATSAGFTSFSCLMSI